MKHILALLTSLLICTATSAQNFDKIIPMGEWVEHKVIAYSSNPVDVHLRTGYESAVIFPEPISLHAINSRLISAQYDGALPGCDVDIKDNWMSFSPLQRMQPTAVAVRGTDSGTIYQLLVSSSPTGSRQPIEIQK